MAAKGPGRRRPVKTASRRSRSRTARALTGLRRSGSGASIGRPRRSNLYASDGEVREVLAFQQVGQTRRLWCKNAPRANCLICLFSSVAQPPRTSPLLSCHRSVGGLGLAVPAQSLAKLRTGKKQTKHCGSGFRAGSLQSICRIFGGRTCITCCEIEQSQGAGAAAAVPVVCRSGAGRPQADGSPSDVVMSGVVDSEREIGHGNIDANDPRRTSALQRWSRDR
jgi:hypothetical protein